MVRPSQRSSDSASNRLTRGDRVRESRSLPFSRVRYRDGLDIATEEDVLFLRPSHN
jgi:hypothetical protein